jgi:hypothetical protein
MRGIVVCSSMKSSGSARTTIEESAKATATETASATSSARACDLGGDAVAMRGGYADCTKVRLNISAASCCVRRCHPPE